jgi:hypothetical protein
VGLLDKQAVNLPKSSRQKQSLIPQLGDSKRVQERVFHLRVYRARKMAVPSSAAAATAAARLVLQQRALQCSFSSVFHLRRAGMKEEQAKFVENMFVGAVGGPLFLLGTAGLWTACCCSSTHTTTMQATTTNGQPPP